MHKLKWLASLCSFDLAAVTVVTPPQVLTGDMRAAAATAVTDESPQVPAPAESAAAPRP